MDARIRNAEDVKKLEHCEILAAEQGVMGDAPALKLVLRSLDETMFTLWLVPGLQHTITGNINTMKPTMGYITREEISVNKGAADA